MKGSKELDDKIGGQRVGSLRDILQLEIFSFLLLQAAPEGQSADAG